MKTQILYATMTGHSRKIAKAIAQKTGFPLYDLKTQPQIPPCDTLLIVSGIYGGESKPDLLEFAKNLPVGHVGRILLLTSSTRNLAQGSLRKVLTDGGHNVESAEYLCQGGFLLAALGHPNRKEVEDAVAFVVKMLEGTAAYD